MHNLLAFSLKEIDTENRRNKPIKQVDPKTNNIIKKWISIASIQRDLNVFPNPTGKVSLS